MNSWGEEVNVNVEHQKLIVKSECTGSQLIDWGKNKQNTVFAIGRSILNRTSKTDIGNLCLEYGGGGHEAAGTCQVENLRAESILEEITVKITGGK